MMMAVPEINFMPAESEAQRRYMGYELGKQEKTGSNDTGMSRQQLADFAKKPSKRLPERKQTRRERR